jgi:hypothetical protein
LQSPQARTNVTSPPAPKALQHFRHQANATRSIRRGECHKNIILPSRHDDGPSRLMHMITKLSFWSITTDAKQTRFSVPMG